MERAGSGGMVRKKKPIIQSHHLNFVRKLDKGNIIPLPRRYLTFNLSSKSLSMGPLLLSSNLPPPAAPPFCSSRLCCFNPQYVIGANMLSGRARFSTGGKPLETKTISEGSVCGYAETGQDVNSKNL